MNSIRAFRKVVASGVLASALAFPSLSSAQTIELKAGDFQSTQHVLSKDGIAHWMRAVEQKTDGKVKFTHFPSEQAAKAKGLLDAVKSGALDIAFMGPTYNTDRLPLYSVVGLPGTYESAAKGSPVLHSMTKSGPLHEEFLKEGIYPIFSVVLPPYQILLKDKKINSLKDFAGLKIRTGGTTQALTARALGATGINLAGPEVYTALERGTVDGIVFPLSSVPGYNLQEVVKSISTNGSFGGYGMTLIANRGTFEKLPEDVRTAMLEAGEETVTHLANAQDGSIDELKVQWKAAGINLFAFMASVKEDWVTRVSKQDAKAPEVLEQYMSLIADTK